MIDNDCDFSKFLQSDLYWSKIKANYYLPKFKEFKTKNTWSSIKSSCWGFRGWTMRSNPTVFATCMKLTTKWGIAIFGSQAWVTKRFSFWLGIRQKRQCPKVANKKLNMHFLSLYLVSLYIASKIIKIILIWTFWENDPLLFQFKPEKNRQAINGINALIRCM